MAVSFGHKCVAMEEIGLLREDMAEERRLKDETTEKAKFDVDRASKFAQKLAECEQVSNQNRENAREGEKKVIALTKEKEAMLLKIDIAKVETLESYKKTNDFAKAAERHLMLKIVKVMVT